MALELILPLYIRLIRMNKGGSCGGSIKKEVRAYSVAKNDGVHFVDVLVWLVQYDYGVNSIVSVGAY
ncbi:hypothetical protein D3C76_821790 [compost metagenome]